MGSGRSLSRGGDVLLGHWEELKEGAELFLVLQEELKEGCRAPPWALGGA